MKQHDAQLMAHISIVCIQVKRLENAAKGRVQPMRKEQKKAKGAMIVLTAFDGGWA